MSLRIALLLGLALVTGCSPTVDPADAAVGQDAGPLDAGAATASDASTADAGVDAGSDGGAVAIDAGSDAGAVEMDAGSDAGAVEMDAGTDAGPVATDAGSDAGVTPDAGGPVFVLGAAGADCNTTCSLRGLGCAGKGSVGFDCQVHMDRPTCNDPLAWIYREHPGEAPHCQTAWGTSEVCANNYNVSNAFCCRCD